MSFAIDMPMLQQVMLAAVRIAVFLAIAPPFSYRGFPARVKAMLGVALALAIAPQADAPTAGFEAAAFIGALVLEVAVGALLGFLVMIVFAAVQAAGNLIDVFGGFQLAQAFDPLSTVNGAQFTRLFQLIALVLLFTTGGHQLIIAGIARSFSAVPPGAAFELNDPMAVAVAAVGQLLLAAAQIAGPLVVVLFLADVGLGLLTRVAPALNAFALGFPLKILITFSLVGVVVVALPHAVQALTDDALRSLTGVR